MALLGGEEKKILQMTFKTVGKYHESMETLKKRKLLVQSSKNTESL